MEGPGDGLMAVRWNHEDTGCRRSGTIRTFPLSSLTKSTESPSPISRKSVTSVPRQILKPVVTVVVFSFSMIKFSVFNLELRIRLEG